MLIDAIIDPLKNNFTKLKAVYCQIEKGQIH